MSGRKSNLKQYQTIVNGDMSAATITSSVTNIEQMDNIGVQLNFTGSSPVGVFNVQASIDYNQDNNGNVINAGHWVNITLNPPAVPSGNSGSIYIDLNQLSTPWIRVQYVKTSGTGTVNGWICGKMM